MKISSQRLLVLLLAVVSMADSTASTNDGVEFYTHGPVKLKILWNKPSFTECGGELQYLFRGLSDAESQIDLTFLDYSSQLSNLLAYNSLVKLDGSLAAELPTPLDIEEGSYAYLARIYIVHPAMLEDRWFSLKYFGSGCAEITQFAPDYGDAYFEAFALIETSFEIIELESRGLWH